MRPANSAPGIMNLFLALYKHRVNCFSILARVWTLRRVFGYGTFKVGTLSCITNRFWSMGCFHIMSIPRWNLETCLSYLYVFPTSVDRNAAGKLIQNLQWPAIDAHIASSALALGIVVRSTVVIFNLSTAPSPRTLTHIQESSKHSSIVNTTTRSSLDLDVLYAACALPMLPILIGLLYSCNGQRMGTLNFYTAFEDELNQRPSALRMWSSN